MNVAKLSSTSALLSILALRSHISPFCRAMSTSDVISRKKELRKEVRTRLRGLTKDDIQSQSQKVWDRLFDLPSYQKAKSVGLFLSMPAGEIDTDIALRNAFEAGKEIYVPQVGKNFEQADMELLKVIAEAPKDGSIFHQKWPRNKWGIPEPPEDMPLHPARPGDIDLIVVPGLAFDKNGDRLGQGKGYYDRFLERMVSGEAQTPTLVAVGLDAQLVESIPVDGKDHRMDMILLPSMIIEAPKSS